MSADDGLFRAAAAAPDVLDLERAYRSHYAPLVTFLSKRLPERSIAADIAQTVFASLAARAPIQPVGDIRGYLFRAARNQLADYYRKEEARHQGAERIGFDPVFVSAAGARSPEEAAIEQDKLKRLRAIINAMPSKRRTVFILSRFRELTETEIAARLGMSAAAVRQHVSRAMRDCQAEMTRIFDEPARDRPAGRLNGRAAKRS